jgi:hypothetical protein
VSKLKPVEQDVILLILDRDLSLTDIGLLLNMPEGTVKREMGGKIYGLFIKELKSDSPRGTHIWSSSTEEVLLRKLDAAVK